MYIINYFEAICNLEANASLLVNNPAVFTP